MFPMLPWFRGRNVGRSKEPKMFGYRHILGHRHWPYKTRNVPKQDANLCRCDFNLRLLTSRLCLKISGVYSCITHQTLSQTLPQGVPSCYWHRTYARCEWPWCDESHGPLCCESSQFVDQSIGSYCWWLKSGINSPVEVGSLSHYL